MHPPIRPIIRILHGLRSLRSEPITAALPGRRAVGVQRGPVAGPDVGAGAAAAAGAWTQRDPRERALVGFGIGSPWVSKLEIPLTTEDGDMIFYI